MDCHTNEELVVDQFLMGLDNHELSVQVAAAHGLHHVKEFKAQRGRRLSRPLIHLPERVGVVIPLLLRDDLTAVVNLHSVTAVRAVGLLLKI